MARGRLAGKTIPQIAKETGFKPDTVAHVVTGPEVKGIISQAMIVLQPEMFGLLRNVVLSLESEFAPNTKNTFDQREKARHQALTVLQLGQPKVPDPPAAGQGAVPGGGVLLGDMLTHYRSIVMGPAGIAE